MHHFPIRRVVALFLVLATSGSATAQQGTPQSSGTPGSGTPTRSMTLVDEQVRAAAQRGAIRRMEGTGRRTSIVRLDDGQTGQTALARAELAAVTAGGVAAINAIIGTARDAADNLLPDIALQLRDLRNGMVVGRTQTSATGQFAFQTLENGTYVVEMVTLEGAIVALSDAVTIGSGEIVQTIVQLSARTRSFGWALGNATASAVNSAVSAGVLAVDPGPPVSPEG